MRMLLLLLVPVLLAAESESGPEEAPSTDREWQFQLGMLLGSMSFDADEWGAVDGQGLLGFQFDCQPRSWPVGLAADLVITSAEEEVDGVIIRGGTVSYALGARKHWRQRRWDPFFGGGVMVTAVQMEADFSGVVAESEGVGVGLWAGGGLGLLFGRHGRIAIEARVHAVEAEMEKEYELDASGIGLGLSGGFFW